MANSTMNSSNGTARKSLASQIDRLDNILDGLADGLNDAVTMLVRESVQAAVREAVQGIVTEFLSKPEILAKLQSILAPKADKAPSTKPSWIRRSFCAIGGMLGSGFGRLCRLPNLLWRNTGLIAQFKVPLSIAVVVGLMTGIAVFFAGPWLAALAGGVGGFVASLWLQLMFNLCHRSLMPTAN